MALATVAPKPTADDIARAFVRGHTTEEVIRLMAREPKADPRLGHLVARLDAKAIRRDPPPATCTTDCAWCGRHPYTPHPLG